MPKYRVKFPEIIAVRSPDGQFTWELPDGTIRTEYIDGSANVTFRDFYEEIKDEVVQLTLPPGRDWQRK